MRRTPRRLVLVSALLVSLAALGAPDRIAYQGVLRNAASVPLNGSYDVVFRFYGAATAGDEILVDRHETAAALAVVVSTGLFTVDLGGGVVQDGSGPGTYTSLAQAFSAYADVWLQLQVSGETLLPRVRLLSAPYALNADRLGGAPAGNFLDTSSTGQAKAGKLVAGAASGTGFAYGLEGYGTAAGGYFKDSNGTGSAIVGYGTQGIEARGTGWAGSFLNDAASGQAFLAAGDDGVRGFGNNAGGYFADSTATGRGWAGMNDYGLVGTGSSAGGWFYSDGGSGSAYVATVDLGISAAGAVAGGLFSDTNGSGYAYAGYGDNGVRALGSVSGGYFGDTNGSGYANVGTGDYGIQGFGNFAGGYFECTGTGYTGEVWLGDRNRGVWSRGTEAGGFFYDSDDSGWAWVGYGDVGVHAYGLFGGLYAEGANWAAEFHDTTGSGWARIAYGEQGIQAFGNSYGGAFSDPDSGSSANVGSGPYKIVGSGTVSFMQNHPEDKSHVIVYHAPEASEVAVFTRGTGRLEKETASVPLDPTFRWVTNPDRGLTVHLTPRGRSCTLHTIAVSSDRLDVGADEAGCQDVEFDYMVWGLRIGFEELAPVQPKSRESKIPSTADHEQYFASEPQLREFTAAARFPAEKGSTRATALRERIGVFDPAVDSIVDASPSRPPAADPASEIGTTGHEPVVPAPATPAEVAAVGLPPPEIGERRATSGMRLPVVGDVEAGDLLSLSPEVPGAVRRAEGLGDPGVIGVAADSPSDTVEVLGSGFATVKADAAYGPIRPGDLLAPSPTRGHVMRAVDPSPGTVVGKAIDGLDAGNGIVRVLLLAR